MSQTVTNAIELAVGLGCLIAAFGARRERWLAAGLLVAGLAAVARSIVALA